VQNESTTEQYCRALQSARTMQEGAHLTSLLGLTFVPARSACERASSHRRRLRRTPAGRALLLISASQVPPQSLPPLPQRSTDSARVRCQVDGPHRPGNSESSSAARDRSSLPTYEDSDAPFSSSSTRSPRGPPTLEALHWSHTQQRGCADTYTRGRSPWMVQKHVSPARSSSRRRGTPRRGVRVVALDERGRRGRPGPGSRSRAARTTGRR
jgi:hypothetical protein